MNSGRHLTRAESGIDALLEECHAVLASLILNDGRELRDVPVTFDGEEWRGEIAGGLVTEGDALALPCVATLVLDDGRRGDIVITRVRDIVQSGVSGTDDLAEFTALGSVG